jgi:hypothetical protein
VSVALFFEPRAKVPPGIFDSMSSGFVSGGTIDNEVERDDAWREAQKEIEEKRRLKYEDEEKRGASGQSLFEVLQANKGMCFLAPLLPKLWLTC